MGGGLMERVLVLHGPNLNLLGEREPEIYGNTTYRKLNQQIKKWAKGLDFSVIVFQSNHEGALIDRIQRERRNVCGVLINPGAFTHYSYALRDAIASVSLPTVEVHLSDISKRESFRRHSVIKAVCFKQISGHGPESYLIGMQYLRRKLNNVDRKPAKKN